MKMGPEDDVAPLNEPYRTIHIVTKLEKAAKEKVAKNVRTGLMVSMACLLSAGAGAFISSKIKNR